MGTLLDLNRSALPVAKGAQHRSGGFLDRNACRQISRKNELDGKVFLRSLDGAVEDVPYSQSRWVEQLFVWFNNLHVWSGE